MNITRHTQAFIDAAHRVSRGEITRIDAAAQLNLNPGTFAVWMSRSKIKADKSVKPTKQLAGAALGLLQGLDPDKAQALDEAVARVVSGEITLAEARGLYPDLSGSTLTVRVRKANARLGVTVKRRRTPAEMAAVRAAQAPK